MSDEEESNQSNTVESVEAKPSGQAKGTRRVIKNSLDTTKEILKKESD